MAAPAQFSGDVIDAYTKFADAARKHNSVSYIMRLIIESCTADSSTEQIRTREVAKIQEPLCKANFTSAYNEIMNGIVQQIFYHDQKSNMKRLMCSFVKVYEDPMQTVDERKLKIQRELFDHLQFQFAVLRTTEEDRKKNFIRDFLNIFDSFELLVRHHQGSCPTATES